MTAYPTYRSTSVGDGAVGVPVTAPLPAGAVEGDLLLLQRSSANNQGAIAGWTAITNVFFNIHAHWFWRVATAGDVAAGTLDLGAVNASTSVWVHAFADPDAVSPVQVAASIGTAGESGVPAPSVTTTGPALLVSLVADSHVNGSSVYLAPVGMTLRHTGGDATGAFSGAMATEERPSAGATGTRQWNAPQPGSANYLAASVALNPTPNVPPNAPTLVSPVGGVSINLAATNRFSWTFSDPDAGDTQSKFDLRYRPATGGAWTVVTGITPNNFYDLPASTLTAGDYEWQVRTYDALGLVGPYSSSAFFTAAIVANDITITAPTNGAAISTETFTVTWSTPTQTHYQLRVVADLAGAPDTSNVIYDTGEIASSGARSRQVSYPDNGVTRHTQVRKKQDGLWSDWASVSNPVSYTQPAIPGITVDDTSQAGAIQVQATHPAPTGSEPTVSYMDVWRRRAKVDADGNFVEWYDTERDPGGENGFPHSAGSLLAPTAIFTDWFVNGGGYSYRVRAVGANGTSSYSEWSDDGSGEVVDEIDGGAPDTVYDDELDGGGP